MKDRPWIIRTYGGHTSAKASNALYHTNLAKGQTGLSVAFDLPTQTGYDPDHEMARGEVGKVGVPISHIGDMRTLFEGIPLDKMNTSMTINATALWHLSLYVAVADEQGADRKLLEGTTQNDILKEFLSRGTFIFPPAPSMRLISDMIIWTVREVPKWNPINVCSYHLQEAGADPVLEIAYTLANAIAVVDSVRETKLVSEDDIEKLVGRISFFCNSGIRIVEETCKMLAFTRMWDRITEQRYGVNDPKYRRFRYGVQVNSLGLTAQQPENNIHRILLEMLPVTLSKNARARAVQLPAWNEALGLPRPWDQQWSIRAQQILAYESDLLEYGDLFEGSKVIKTKTNEIEQAATEEMERVLSLGGSLEAIEYMKEQLVAAQARRQREIEAGERTVVGVNKLTESEGSPLTQSFDESLDVYTRVEAEAEASAVEAIKAWRGKRDNDAVTRAIDRLRSAAESGENLVEPSIEAAKAGVTTGEWAGALREVFGEYRAPTGVSERAAAGSDAAASIGEIRDKLARTAEAIGAVRLRMLVAKPGLDGHSNAAEQVAVRARDVGFEVIYQGIRLTPSQIARAAVDEDVHVIGVSILSGAHGLLIPDLIDELKKQGVDPARVPVVVGGVIPDDDAEKLKELGVARVFTPKDYDLTSAVGEIVDLIASNGASKGATR